MKLITLIVIMNEVGKKITLQSEEKEENVSGHWQHSQPHFLLLIKFIALIACCKILSHSATRAFYWLIVVCLISSLYLPMLAKIEIFNLGYFCFSPQNFLIFLSFLQRIEIF